LQPNAKAHWGDFVAQARQLDNHPLMQDLMAASKPLLERSYRGIMRNVRVHGTMRSKKPRPFKSPVDHYVHAVFFRLMAVIDSFDRLAQAEIMVRRQPPSRTLKKWQLTPDRWLDFQYSCFLVAAVSVEDRCLLLVNDAFRMGLDHRDCKPPVLQRHGMVASRIKKVLRSLAKAIEPHRSPRNSNVHEGDSPRLDELVGWADYSWLPVLARHGDAINVPQDLLAQAFRFSGQRLSVHFRKETTKLRTAVWKLLDALHRPFLSWLNRLGGRGRLTANR
jgi:hypothetical protein